MNDLVHISFHGHNLATADINGKPHVAMKPIVEAIGLQWRAQYHRIQRHPVLSKGVSVMDTPSKGGMQKTLFLPLHMLNGWLFGVDSSRVKPGIRDTLITYQEECFQVLADYWLKGAAVNPRKVLTPEQKCHIQELVNQRSHDTGIHYATLYRSLKSEFRVGSYKEILASDYEKACQFIQGQIKTERGEDSHRYIMTVGRGKSGMMPIPGHCAIVDPRDKTNVSTLIREFVPVSMLPTIIKVSADRLASNVTRGH